MESAIELMEKADYQHNADDILIEQTRNFLRTVLGMYDVLGAVFTKLI